MTRLLSIEDFLVAQRFFRGDYAVRCDDSAALPLLNLRFPIDDGEDFRRLPQIEVPVVPAIPDDPALHAVQAQLDDCERLLKSKTADSTRKAVAGRKKKELQEKLTAIVETNESLRQSQTHELAVQSRKYVLCCLVRAGVQPPGLLTKDLADLHRDAEREHHLELFSDINVLPAGLLLHLLHSLGKRVGRVVISSTSLDVLHEYQGSNQKEHSQRLEHAEMSRSLALLAELRHLVPVHIHQLAPGASRYFDRRNAHKDWSRPEGDHEQRTYISEDRQMIAAYWDYVSGSNPRVPVRFITSDLRLARVCRAERVPFLFARTPHEVQKQADEDGTPLVWQALYLDPFSLQFQYATAHAILWELVLVFRNITVTPVADTGVGRFSLRYRPERVPPGMSPYVEIEMVSDGVARPPGQAHPSNAAAQASTQVSPAPPSAEASVAAPAEDASASAPPASQPPRKLMAKFESFVDLLPPLDQAHRLLQQNPSIAWSVPRRAASPEAIDVATGLRLIHAHPSQSGHDLSSGPLLADFLTALKDGSYERLNEIVRRWPAYDEVLRRAQAEGAFAGTREIGSAAQWALCLGAAYQPEDGYLYGLAQQTLADFTTAVSAAFSQLAGTSSSAGIPQVLDRVCRTLRLSPIRFRGMLEECLRQQLLPGFNVQRATARAPLKAQRLLVFPTSASDSYLQTLELGHGLFIGGNLVAELVRRPLPDSGNGR